MADPIHVNSRLDPEARAIGLVEEVEREALDEDMVFDTLQRVVKVLAERCARSQQIIDEEHDKVMHARRGDRLRANVKGVTPQPRQAVPRRIQTLPSFPRGL